jgi:hypothetical protein
MRGGARNAASGAGADEDEDEDEEKDEDEEDEEDDDDEDDEDEDDDAVPRLLLRRSTISPGCFCPFFHVTRNRSPVSIVRVIVSFFLRPCLVQPKVNRGGCGCNGPAANEVNGAVMMRRSTIDAGHFSAMMR